MNRVIKLLMFSDIFVLTGFGLADPILAIFINENLAGGTILKAGIASTIFLIVKSIVQLPFSRHVDTHDDRDDLKWLIIGTCLIAAVPFLYLSAKSIYIIFFAQLIHGLGSGLAYPSWLGLWSTHLDKSHESFEWSFYSTVVGVGTAVAASVGAAIAQYIGFQITFLITGIMALIGCGILIMLTTNRIQAGHFVTKRTFKVKDDKML